MWPVLLDWQGTVIYAYPLFIGLSWGLGYRLGESAMPHDMTRTQYSLWVLGLFISSWIGAKLLFVLTQDRWATGDLVRAANFWLGGGFVFLGGLLGGGLYTLVVATLLPQFNSKRMSFLLVPLLWAHAVGRVGCFLAGCCYGSESHLPWSVEMHGAHRHPTQLYEAFGLAVLAWLLQTRRFSANKLPTYLLGYGVLRWVVECFRGDELRGAWFGQSTSQWIALLMVISGFALLARLQVVKKT